MDKEIEVVYIGGKVDCSFYMSSDTNFETNGRISYSVLGSPTYLNFRIDNATGRILDWQPLDASDFDEEGEE